MSIESLRAQINRELTMSTKYVLAIEPSESEPERLYYAGPKRNVERIADRVAYSPRDATKFETAAEADELR